MRVAKMLHRWWASALRRRHWSKDDYYEYMLHLDETVKLFTRTAATSCNGDGKKDLRLSFLSNSVSEEISSEYECGVWWVGRIACC